MIGLVIFCNQILAGTENLEEAFREEGDCQHTGVSGQDCSLQMLQRRSLKHQAAVEETDAAMGEEGSKLQPGMPCLCIFDTDRTLTAIQDHFYNPPYHHVKYPKKGVDAVNPSCPGTVSAALAQDSAYPMDFKGPNMTMRLSDLTVNFRNSFCGKHCYRGILSVGTIGGQKLKRGQAQASGYYRMVNELQFYLHAIHDNLSLPCSHANKSSPLGKECSMNAVDAVSASPGDLKPFIINIGEACEKKDPSLGKFSGACKVDFVQNLTAYYKHVAGVTIPDEHVYFFDDACVNVAGFKGTKYRARQIACARRQCWMEPKSGGFLPDNNLGVCGATVDEVNDALSGPPHYLCSVDSEGKCDPSFGCGQD